ncbi:hypothetical protein RclHR1_07160015 [Rhizophagus clarus]|uniref:F-box domain-containing protein n=1 Tax=Rhizophagus clarus TaxID=94130 RepID=A0A2Z6SKE4_9GLOM|nr:hypothetical protein RclHR1_07160015 [Rhizophagus clarus]GES72991.1 hypothetical protein GLOIN_2v1876445 [Rhizophagus clarus]
MSHQLPIDCINEIFEYLDDDKINLRSCLLVNRSWCKSAVRILWRNIWNFRYSIDYMPYRTHVPFAIISTLISCLPDESKDFLNKNGIFISTSTPKSPLFNYASFMKVLSISKFDEMIQHFLKNKKSFNSLSLDYNKHIIAQEIIKMFMIQIPSLKKLYYWNNFTNIPFNIHFTYFNGARDCLIDLSELCCSSDVYPEFFYQLSQICHKLQSLTIEFRDSISNGLADFISVQRNLKDLNLLSFGTKDWTDLIPPLRKLSNTLIKLNVHGGENDVPMLFITSYSNLQELTLIGQISFEELQYANLPELKILKIPAERPKDEILIKFLENNGKNLRELNIDGINSSLRESIIRFCPNLKRLISG